jgi:putative transposase
VNAVFAVMQEVAMSARVTIEQACRILQVSRSGYYAWRRHELSPRAQRDRELLPLVQKIFRHHKRRYGARRIAAELQAQGESCGVQHAGKLLKTAGLRAMQPKSFHPQTTNSRHRLGYSPNLLLDMPEPTTANQLWVGDISYIPIRGLRFGYLAMLMDRCSRMIVSWQLLDNMSEQLVLMVLRGAIRLRQPPSGMIHHSDRGGQYAGHEYRGVLRRAGVRQSMSRADHVHDNAFMESCYGTIKRELEMTEYGSMRQALRAIGEYVMYFNTERRHSSLNYLCPQEFEASKHPSRCL